MAAVSPGAVCDRRRWCSAVSARSTDIASGTPSRRRVRERRDEHTGGKWCVTGAVTVLGGRHRHRHVAPTVEAAGEHDDVGAAGHLLGELHRRLGGLGTRVGEEEGVDAVGADAGQALTELLEQGMAVAVDLRVDEPRRLILDRGNDARVAVARAHHGDAGGEVEVLGAVSSGDDAPRPGDHRQIGDLEPHVRKM